MDLVKVKDKTSTLASVENKMVVKGTGNSKRRILDEDTYTEEMEKIITRDFFPDLKKLKAQNDYLDALQSNDVAKLHELHAAFRPKTLLSHCNSSTRSAMTTPATFETPEVTSNPLAEEHRCDEPSSVRTDKTDVLLELDDVSEAEFKKPKSLDKFLAETTSEDNASFEDIMEKDAAQHQQKYPWLYKDEAAEEQKMRDVLALPSSSETKAIEDRKDNAPITWTYKNKNALMYVPDGVELTTEEKIQFEKRQKIEHSNTRFALPPFDEQANKAAIAEAASVQAKMKEGKVGIDGKEIVTDDSPKVNGYGFVGSPSPAPGITETPIMTWGEIEGTPFQLDGSDTPLPQNPGGQSFRMPEIPARERIALSLADKAAKKNRQKKQEALKHAQSSWLTPSPKFGSSTPLTPLERLQSMSPAAQRLVSAKLGIHRNMDKALRASYSPSPARSSMGDRTPDLVSCTPKTPSDRSVVAKLVPSPSPKVVSAALRSRAKDFF